MNRRPLYVAITATSPPADWHIVQEHDADGEPTAIVVGITKEWTRDLAELHIRRDEGGERHTNIYLDTKLKNLRVVSRSMAKRTYGVDVDRELEALFG